jgi:hypothetical protein
VPENVERLDECAPAEDTEPDTEIKPQLTSKPACIEFCLALELAELLRLKLASVLPTCAGKRVVFGLTYEHLTPPIG